MPDTGAPWNLPSPDLPDQPHGPAQLGDLADSVAAALGRAVPCTSISRPSPVAGMLIFETDTETLSVCNDGTNWQSIWYPHAWTEPVAPFTGGWTNYGSGYPPFGYWKDPWGWVRMRGLIKSGAVGAIYTMPVGYRPAANELFLCSTNHATVAGVARIDVQSTGVISLVQNTGTNLHLSMSGIFYRATQ